MSENSILIITVGCVLITVIICITNFICNTYNDWKNETIKDANKLIKSFEEDFISRTIVGQNCKAEEKDILKFIDKLKNIL